MRKFTGLFLVIGIIFIFQSCATAKKEIPVPEGTLLTQSELEQLFKNSTTYDYKNTKGGWGTITTFPNGTQQIEWNIPNEDGKDTGTYKIVNGKKCNYWDNLPPREDECFQFYKIGENEYNTLADDGKITVTTFK